VPHDVGFQRPDLKTLGGNGFDVKLRERDFIEQPVSPAAIGNVLDAIGEQGITTNNLNYGTGYTALGARLNNPLLLPLPCGNIGRSTP
jgi:hypothetical protein